MMTKLKASESHLKSETPIDFNQKSVQRSLNRIFWSLFFQATAMQLGGSNSLGIRIMRTSRAMELVDSFSRKSDHTKLREQHRKIIRNTAGSCLGRQIFTA